MASHPAAPRTLAWSSIAAFALMAVSTAQAQPHHQALPQPSSGIVTHRIFAEDGVVQLVLHIPIPGKEVLKSHEVQVPIQVNGVVKYKTVTETRSVPATEEKRVPSKGLVTFCDLEGKTLTSEEVAKRIPPTGLVVVLSKSNSIPKEWREVLKPDTIAMLQVPRP